MGVLSIPAFRRREILLGLFISAVLLSALTLFSPPAAHLKRNLHSFTSLYYKSSSSPAQVPELAGERLDTLEVLSQLYEDERVALLSEFDQASTEALVRTAPDALNPDFNAYITRLESFVDTYFNGSTYHAQLSGMLNRLVNAHPPVEESSFEKRVFSFDKNGRAGAPDEFRYWEQRMQPMGWEIEVGDDGKMEEWFEQAAGSMLNEGGVAEEDMWMTGKGRWNEMWRGLGRPVLKSDLLRYLMMLIKGGLYTDSDTSVLSDINLWGTHAHDLTPRGLVALQRAMRHLDPTHPSSKHTIPPSGMMDYNPLDTPTIEGQSEPESETVSNDEAAASLEHAAKPSPSMDLDYASNPVTDVSRGINNPHVSLVLSVEYDVHHGRQDPRFGYTRDLQIVQWTFMAKPMHPVFLDVLETATTEIMSRRAHGTGHDNWQSVLDVTGPGPFTDAVLRYLLIQYGVTPQELLGMEDGALIGDVLILPLHAFGSYLGGEEDWNAHDPSTRCTAHGFRGRWKGDMNFDRRRSVRFRR